MKIIEFPNELLREKSVAVEKVDDELRAFAEEMYQTMLQAGGIGISAPQVGRLVRIIGIIFDGRPLLMFNPVIIKSSPDKKTALEGCLSFPGKFIKVNRPRKIHIKYLNVNNKKEYRELTGIEARAVIHEIEHLDAKLLVDHEK